jgi:hemoglobin
MSVASLFTRLGGEAGLRRLIDLLYQRLLADDHLGEYFMGVDIERLKALQLAFLRKTFGHDSAVYTGRSLHAAHQGQMVTEQAFDQFIDTFAEVAGELAVDAGARDEAIAALRSMRASVLLEFRPNPAYDYKAKPF